jgi:hypothetical protein
MLISQSFKKMNPLSGQRSVKLIALAAFGIMTCCLSLSASSNDKIPYPAGYRDWTHVKSGLVGPQSPFFAGIGGIHHVYANEKAMEGYRTGRFPDGSMIVFDLLEAKESEGVTKEGPRRRIDMMVKDSKQFAESAGWGFQQFKGDNQTDGAVTAEIAKACFACHSKRKDQDFVFSSYRK